MKKEENIIIRVDKVIKKNIFDVAKKSDLSTSHYIRRLMQYAIDNNLKL